MSQVPYIGPAVPEEPHLNIETVRITAQKVIIGKEREEPSPEEQQRVDVNTFLFAVLMVLGWLWFTAHLKTLVTGTIVLGTATAWSVFQAIVTRMTEPIDDADGIRKRLLARPRTMWHLCFFLAVMIFAFVLTSSVHVMLGDAKGRISIRVLEGNSVVRSIRLGDDVKIAGASMWSVFPQRKLALHVAEPSGYHPYTLDLSTGEPAYLRFPDDFSRQTLVRIYVPFGLMIRIPDVGADKHKDTKLTIEAAGQKKEEERYAGKAVYVGLMNPEIAKSLIEKGFAEFAKAQHERLDSVADAGDLANYIAALRHSPVVRPDWNLDKRHTVKATITIKGEAIMECTASVDETRINDCVMKEIKRP